MHLQKRLRQGELIIMDGGTGTELEKRGVTMEEKGWSASSTITQPEILRQIHEEYIRAGADIIITNTFSTSRHVLDSCNLADKFELINATAARIAVEARDNAADRPIYIAGSISTTTFGEKQPTPAVALTNFNDQANILADNGVDFFVLEMMRDIEYTNIAYQAAKQTGLPVWTGYSTNVDAEGKVQLTYTQGTISFADALQTLSAKETPLVSVMHTLIEDIQPSLSVLKEKWSGPIGVYAHSGEFVMPNWQFIDIISPEAYASEAQKWVAQGVQVIGGCCGIGPKHIQVLREILG